MALGIEHGILGTEAYIVINGVTFNDRAAALPRAHILRIPNFYDLPDTDDFVDKKSNQIGEVNRPSMSRGKSFTLVGKAYGNDALELREYVNAIRGAIAGIPGTPARSATVEVVHIPHPTYGAISWGYPAKVHFVADEDPTANTEHDALSKYQMPFTIPIRNLDGRVYVIDEVDVGPYASAATHVEAVGGTAPTDPIITGRVDGTATSDIYFENLSLDIDGATALIRYNQTPDAHFTPGVYTFDWARRAIDIVPDVGTPFDGWDYYLQWSDNWTKQFVPGLIPGNNSIKVTGLNDWHLKYKVRSW